MTTLEPPAPSPWPDDADGETANLDDELAQMLAEAATDDPNGDLVDVEVAGQDLGTYATAHRELIPYWVKAPRVGVGMAKRWSIDRAEALMFHALRSPIYWAKLVWWGRVTVWRALRWALTFMYCGDAKGDLAVARVHAREGASLNLVKEYRKTLWVGRAANTTVVVVGLLALGWVAANWMHAPWWAKGLGLAVVGFAIGWPARPTEGDLGILARRTKRWTLPPVTSEALNEALIACGIPKLTKAIEANPHSAIGYPHRLQRNHTDTATVGTIVLPRGVTAEEVMNNLKPFAGALERAKECVVLGEVRDKPPSWLSLFITDEPLSSQPPPTWPLERRGSSNFFGEVPVGTDIQGRPRDVGPNQNTFLIAALAGHGKSALANELALGICLDPRVEAHIADCKGGGDWKDWRSVAHFYACAPDMLDIGEDILADLRAVQRDMKRRYKMLGQMDEAELPDNRIYDELVDRHPSLRPILYVIDECQEAFNPRPFAPPEEGKKDGPSGKDIAAIVENLIRRGRAVGIVVMLITQKPDRIAIPTNIRDLLTVRFCGRVTKVDMVRMILGDHYAGPSPISFSTADQGLWVLSGVTDEGVLVRAPYLDAGKVKGVLGRILAAKRAGGWLSGMAVGDVEEEESEPTPSVLEHLINGWPADRRTLRTSECAGVLVACDGIRYRGWTPDQVTTALKRFVVSVDAKGEVKYLDTEPKYIDDGSKDTRRGVRRVDVEAALRHLQRELDGRPPVRLAVPELDDEVAVWPALGEVDDEDWELDDDATNPIIEDDYPEFVVEGDDEDGYGVDLWGDEDDVEDGDAAA